MAYYCIIINSITYHNKNILNRTIGASLPLNEEHLYYSFGCSAFFSNVFVRILMEYFSPKLDNVKKDL